MEMLEVMRRVLLCTLEAMEGKLCLRAHVEAGGMELWRSVAGVATWMYGGMEL